MQDIELIEQPQPLLMRAPSADAAVQEIIVINAHEQAVIIAPQEMNEQQIAVPEVDVQPIPAAAVAAEPDQIIQPPA